MNKPRPNGLRIDRVKGPSGTWFVHWYIDDRFICGSKVTGDIEAARTFSEGIEAVFNAGIEEGKIRSTR